MTWDEGSEEYAARDLAERLFGTYNNWVAEFPQHCTAGAALTGVTLGLSEILYGIVHDGARPGQALEALDEALIGVRRRVLEREP